MAPAAVYHFWAISNPEHATPAALEALLLFLSLARNPIYLFSVGPGSTDPDVKTLKKLLADINTLGYEKIKVVSGFSFRLYENSFKASTREAGREDTR